MSKQTFILVDDKVKYRARDAVTIAHMGYVVTIQEPTRTLEQNAAQFPYLQGFAEQLPWTVNGDKVWLTALEYKDILTSAYEGEVYPRLASAWEGGGLVMLGRRTSSYSKERFSEWLEWLKAAAALKEIEPVYKQGEQNVS